MKKLAQYLLIAFLLNIDGNIEALAATITARSCSNSDIQLAINSASSGDTVSVPAGNCTWTDSVSIPSTKGITIQGGGIGITNIVLGPTTAGFMLTVGDKSLYRITGFTIKSTGPGGGFGAGSCSGAPININGVDSSLPNTFRSNFRIDNIRIYSDPQQTEHKGAICVSHMVYGVMDHVSIEGIGRGWFFQQGYNADITYFGDHSWTTPLDPGGPLNVYVEDSSYSCSMPNSNFCQVYDGREGGRAVFRHNTVTNGWIEPHAPQGYNRGILYNEIYENTFTSQEGGAWQATRLRGGTGVVYNNTVIDPDGGTQFYVESRRACDGDPNFYCLMYPCIDGLGRGPYQVLTPVYGWGNTLNGSPTNLITYASCEKGHTIVQENRDFYNTKKPGYTAYTYPHPLQGMGPLPAPQPPSPPGESGVISPKNVRIVN